MVESPQKDRKIYWTVTGITEYEIGIPEKSSMEVAEVGKTETGVPVYMDKNALQADCIIPVGRIKPHTDFRGGYESGLMKMIVIGLGKQKDEVTSSTLVEGSN